MSAEQKLIEINDFIMQDVNLAMADQRAAFEILELILKAVEKSPKVDKLIKADCEKVFKLRLLGFGDNQPSKHDLELIHERSMALASDNGLIAMIAQELNDPRQSATISSSHQSESFALPLYMCKLTEDTAAAINDKVLRALSEHIKHCLVFEAHAQSSFEMLVKSPKADAAMLKQVQNSLIIQRDLNERLNNAQENTLSAYAQMSIYLCLAEALFTLCRSVVMLVNATRIFALSQAHLTMSDKDKQP